MGIKSIFQTPKMRREKYQLPRNILNFLKFSFLPIAAKAFIYFGEFLELNFLRFREISNASQRPLKLTVLPSNQRHISDIFQTVFSLQGKSSETELLRFREISKISQIASQPQLKPTV